MLTLLGYIFGILTMLLGILGLIVLGLAIILILIDAPMYLYGRFKMLKSLRRDLRKQELSKVLKNMRKYVEENCEDEETN